MLLLIKAGGSLLNGRGHRNVRISHPVFTVGFRWFNKVSEGVVCSVEPAVARPAYSEVATRPVIAWSCDATIAGCRYRPPGIAVVGACNCRASRAAVYIYKARTTT